VVERDGGFLRWEELWSPGVEKLCSEGPPIIESATLSAGFALPLKLDGHDVLFPALARFSSVVTEEALALACSPEGPPVTSEMCESHKGKYQGVGQGIAYRNGLDDRRLSRCGFYKLLSWAEWLGPKEVDYDATWWKESKERRMALLDTAESVGTGDLD
jgi:hypothetical protein